MKKLTTAKEVDAAIEKLTDEILDKEGNVGVVFTTVDGEKCVTSTNGIFGAEDMLMAGLHAFRKCMDAIEEDPDWAPVVPRIHAVFPEIRPLLDRIREEDAAQWTKKE